MLLLDSEIKSVEVDIANKPAPGPTPDPSSPSTNAGLPGWAIALIVIGGVILLACLAYVLLFFVFNKWINKKNKAVRVIKLGKKDDKIKLLTMSFRFEYRNESEVYNSKNEALK